MKGFDEQARGLKTITAVPTNLKMWKLLSAVFVLMIASRSQAAETTDPCALQYQAMIGALGKSSEYEDASSNYKQCAAIAYEQKKTEFAATRNTWAASLDRLPSGGWVFIEVSLDGTVAIFGSTRHATHTGNVVSVWLRYEYRDERSGGSSMPYKASVQRVLYDCSKVASKNSAVTYYSENNLGSVGESYTYDEAKLTWAPAIPGTIGDTLLDWACRAVPKSNFVKAN